MTAVFVTATGTEVGKTFVSRGLIHALRAKGRTVEPLKPVQSGYDPREAEGSDAGLLVAAAGGTVSEDSIAGAAPYRFEAPLAPHLAAKREGRSIDADAVAAFCKERLAGRKDAMVIEGVGGVMAPLDARRTVLDLMAALGLPVVLVAGSYLGTISHTLTAVDVLKRRGLSLAAVVVSESPGKSTPLDETVETLRDFLPGVPVFVVRRVITEDGNGIDQPVFEEIAAVI